MPVHPNSLANLMPPWKPGQSGNPTGKRRRPIVDRVEERIAEQAGVSEERATDMIAERWAAMILGGDAAMLKEFLARRDGPVVNRRQETWAERTGDPSDVAAAIRSHLDAMEGSLEGEAPGEESGTEGDAQ